MKALGTLSLDDCRIIDFMGRNKPFAAPCAKARFAQETAFACFYGALIRTFLQS